MGLELLTENSHVASNLLTCIRYPNGMKATDILPAMKGKGWFLAAGLHPECKDEYFRIGHMGWAVTKTDLVKKLLGDLKTIIKA
jgi:alanine-glyoxylate transaminase/serine-glyoxylate transaminase/serine-pyruvate transaminase